MQKIASALSLIILLTACASEAQHSVARDQPSGAVISLDVRTVSLVDRNNAQLTDSPYSKNDFRPTIAEAIREWASTHLKAVGAQGDAIVIIRDASLSSQPIPHSTDMFTRVQASKYTAHASVGIEVKGGAKGDYAMADAEASRFETLPENPTIAERQNTYTTVLNGVMRDLSQNLDGSIRDHMRAYVITAPIIDGPYGAVPPPTAQ